MWFYEHLGFNFYYPHDEKERNVVVINLFEIQIKQNYHQFRICGWIGFGKTIYQLMLLILNVEHG